MKRQGKKKKNEIINESNDTLEIIDKNSNKTDNG